VVKQLGDGQRADAHRVPTCPKAIPLVIHKKSPCACLALFIVQVYINTSCNTIDVDKARRLQSPLCARIVSLLACAMPLPARALRARMPDTCLHVPCPCLRVRCACTCLQCLFSLHTVDDGILLRSDIPLPRVFKGALGRAAAEGFSPTSPRAHWIGPES